MPNEVTPSSPPVGLGVEEKRREKQRDILETVAWGMRHFGSVVTNRTLPRRDVMREVHRGTVKSIGWVQLCDGNGFLTEPERFREGFVLTDAGKAILAASQPETPYAAK